MLGGDSGCPAEILPVYRVVAATATVTTTLACKNARSVGDGSGAVAGGRGGWNPATGINYFVPRWLT
ncbi:hypothetical protein GYH30_015992 [Glycine max]|nr:hypothetical protein GYH30_015992 [Glycine max]